MINETGKVGSLAVVAGSALSALEREMEGMKVFGGFTLTWQGQWGVHLYAKHHCLVGAGDTALEACRMAHNLAIDKLMEAAGQPLPEDMAALAKLDIGIPISESVITPSLQNAKDEPDAH